MPREVIVAIWGIETSYGANQGGKRVIPSLATLAFHNYKGDFARDELITALLILQEGHIPPERMIGSWAGAMGQPQFIPSSFMRWAVDFSGDGKRDLWTSVPDVLASIANYLREHGWQKDQPWGFEVQVPQGFDYRKSRGSFREWVTLGFRRTDGGNLPTTTTRDEATLLFPSGARGPAFLVTKNFEVIKTYNISDVYALAVLHLADRFRGAPPFAGRWPDERCAALARGPDDDPAGAGEARLQAEQHAGHDRFRPARRYPADAGEIRDDAGRASDAGIFGAV